MSKKSKRPFIKTLRQAPKARDKKKIIDWAQNLAIIALIATALMLSAFSGLFGEFSGKVLGSGNEASTVSKGYAVAATPLCIVVTPEEGSHRAVMHDAEALDEMYTRHSPSLAEALGSSNEPQQVTVEEFNEALHNNGIFFDFFYSQPLAVVAGWLGTGVSGGASEHTARRLCLSIDGDYVSLYYIRTWDGKPYRCTTALSSGALSPVVSESRPNGAAFCFELDMFDLLDQYVIIFPEQENITAATAANAIGNVDADAAMTVLGMNSFLSTSYPESDGALVSVEGSATLRLERDGVLKYNRNPGGEELQALDPADAIELARSVCEETAGAYCGDAELTMSYVGKRPDSGEFIICFDYVLDGVPVSLAGGVHAVQIHIRGSVVVNAVMYLREYSLQNSAVSPGPLPPMQEAAVVQALGGGEPRLCYVDDFETISVKWLVK